MANDSLIQFLSDSEEAEVELTQSLLREIESLKKRLKAMVGEMVLETEYVQGLLLDKFFESTEDKEK